MKRIVLIVVAILLAIGLIATLNGNEYIGLTGVLQRIAKIDFSFSDTVSMVIRAFDTFGSVGSSNNVMEAVKLAIEGLTSLLRTPFIALLEVVELIRDIFDLLFALVGVF